MDAVEIMMVILIVGILLSVASIILSAVTNVDFRRFFVFGYLIIYVLSFILMWSNLWNTRQTVGFLFGAASCILLTPLLIWFAVLIYDPMRGVDELGGFTLLAGVGTFLAISPLVQPMLNRYHALPKL